MAVLLEGVNALQKVFMRLAGDNLGRELASQKDQHSWPFCHDRGG